MPGVRSFNRPRESPRDLHLARSRVMSLGFCLRVLGPALHAFACLAGAQAAERPKVIVLGFDGCDGVLTQQFMDEGLLPHLKELRDSGCFHKLLTSNPGESPVAWA